MTSFNACNITRNQGIRIGNSLNDTQKTPFIGSQIRSAGDFNGDGCDNVIIASKGLSAVYMIYSGSALESSILVDMIKSQGVGKDCYARS